MMTKEQERATALKIFAEPCFGKTDKHHGGNCVHCCLRGEGLPNTADDQGRAPNYAGWARLYVQAERTIPARFAQAFAEELNSSNEAYRYALIYDIAHWGVSVERV